MNWLDLFIVVLPVSFVVGMAVYCRKFVTDVSGYLVAGRLANRYVLAVSSVASAAMGALILIGYIEAHYKTGFAIQFWNNLKTNSATASE